MDAVLQLSSTVGIESACDVLGVARASFYRRRPLLGPTRLAPSLVSVTRPIPARALHADELQAVRALLNSERFQDCSPAAIHATLLDEGRYFCSTRTMYRILEGDGATRERRDQLVHPQYQKPELLAAAPNQLGVGTLPNCAAPPSGPTFTSTSSSMSSAVTSSAGWWPLVRAPSWPGGSSKKRAKSRTSNRTNSDCTPTADPPCDLNRWHCCWPI